MMRKFENSFCTQVIISILLVTIICVFIGISYKDTLVVIILTGLVIFALQISQLYVYQKNKRRNLNILHSLELNNKQTNNKQDNNNQTNNNQTNNNQTNNNLLNSEQENIKLVVNDTKKPYHLTNTSDNIIDANKYNLDDCTTDKSCIQKPDVNNLFTGFENRKEYLEAKKNLNILPNQNIDHQVKKKDKLVVENFESQISPCVLNDVVKPFNNAVINPYENYSHQEELIIPNEKNLSVEEINKNLSFHSKIGKCEGGICKDLNELKSQELREIVKEINEMKKNNIKRYHPFSKNFPVIRTTSEDAHY